MRPFFLFCMMVFCVGESSAQGQISVLSDSERLNRLKLISQTVSVEIPLVIAHRGASGYLPEHTLEAAAFAHALGADFIEQDVVLSKDGVAIVMHDITLDAVTNVAEIFPERERNGHFFVFDFTLSELRQLNVHERNTDRPRFPQATGQFRIATLEEHLQLIQGLNVSRKRNVGVYVEIKSPARHREQGLDSSIEVLELLKKYGYESADDRAYLQCFDEKEVLRIRTELQCRLPLIQLYSKCPDEKQIEQAGRIVDGLGVRITDVVSTSPEDGKPVVSDLVKTAHKHALMVHVWTFRTDDLPNFADSATVLLNKLVKEGGVDGVFADQPDAVLKWRAAARMQVKLRGPFHLLND